MSIKTDRIMHILRAAKDGNMNLAADLIEQMTDEEDSDEVTVALYEFCRRDQPSLIKHCLECIVWVDEINFIPVLTCALRKQAWEIIDSVLQLKIDLNQQDIWGRTILMYSIRNGSHAFVQYLLKIGANPEIRSASGAVALHDAVVASSTLLAGILIYHGARLDKFDKSGNSPLHVAVTRRDFEMVDLLLSYGADPNLSNQWKEYVLFDACHSTSRIWTLLLQHGADPGITAEDGWTVLHELATGRLDDCLEKAEQLLMVGAPIDLVARHQRTPLHVAIEHGCTPMARLLVNNGANIEHPSWGLKTPLLLATETDDCFEIMKLLLEADADPNVCNEIGLTPVKIAYMLDSAEKLICLLDFDAKPYDPWGNSKYFGNAELPRNTSGIMIKYLAECPYKGGFVDESDIRRLRKHHSEGYELYKQYRDELYRMDSMMFYKDVSYLEIYRGSVPSPLPYSREAGFEDKVYEPIRHLFPLYYADLLEVLEGEHIQGRLWEYTERQLTSIFGKTFPWGVIRKIASYVIADD